MKQLSLYDRPTGGYPYRGSKWTYRHSIIRSCPPSVIFIDLFCGSCAVAVAAVESGKYKSVIANDVNKRMVRALLVMRDRAKELHDYLKATPHSREVFDLAKTDLDNEDDVVAAAHVLISLTQSGAPVVSERVARSSWNLPSPRSDKGREANFSASAYATTCDRIYQLRHSLLRISFECADWNSLLDKIEKRRAAERHLIFCDPPYKMTSSYYDVDFNHENFIDRIITTDIPVVVMEQKDDPLCALQEAGWKQLLVKSRYRGRLSEDAMYFSPAAQN